MMEVSVTMLGEFLQKQTINTVMTESHKHINNVRQLGDKHALSTCSQNYVTDIPAVTIHM